jgi:FkbM family methyltransferase
MAHFLLRHPNAYLLQIGAYNGRDGDPVHSFVKNGLLRGCLLEPQHEAFSQLKETYRGLDGILLINAAIADQCGKRTLFYIPPGTPGPAWQYQLASFFPQTIRKHTEIQNLDELIVSKDVDCVTFDWLFENIGVDHIDVLVIDTEGYDFEVLKLFNLSARLPSVIHYEYKHLSRPDMRESVDMLLRAGYSISFDADNVTGYRCLNEGPVLMPDKKSMPAPTRRPIGAGLGPRRLMR